MAEAASDLLEFNCPICLSVLSDPVTTPCGHSYCKVCIQHHWGEQKDPGAPYSCVQCRRTFTGAPLLKRNIKLAEAAAKLTKTQIDQLLENVDPPETLKTQEIFKQVVGLLDGLGAENFRERMKVVSSFSVRVDTEDRLKGVIDLIYQQAVSHPDSTLACAHMCHCLMGLKVPSSADRGMTLNFRKLLLNRCQKAFECNNSELLEMEKKLETVTKEKDRHRLTEELKAAKEQVLGNSRLISELFKLKMLTEAVMHDTIVKLMKEGDETSLECLCIMLTIAGKNLDHIKAKPRMDQYFKHILILMDRTECPRIRSKLQEVLDLRRRGHEDIEDIEDSDKQQGVSSGCVADLHPEHDTVSAAAKTTTKQTEPTVRTYQQRIQENEEEIQMLRKNMETVKRLAQATVEESERFYTKMMEKRFSEERELIRTKEKEVLKEAEGFLQTLEQEIAELRRAEEEDGQLSPTSELPHFFQKLPSIHLVFKIVQNRVSGLHDQFEDVSKSDFERMSSSVEDLLGPYTFSSLCSKAVEEQDLDGYLDLETVRTQEMLAQMDDLLDGLDSENFQERMKVASAVRLDTEERLQRLVHLVHEYAVSRMDASEAYANMCHSLMGVLNNKDKQDRHDTSWRIRVPTSDSPGHAARFHKLLLNRCQKDFDRDNHALLKEKQKELKAATEDEERRRLRGELKEAREEVLGNSRFMSELVKVKMLTEELMLHCIGTLLENGDGISLECLCITLTTIGKDLDHEKTKPMMDGYYREIESMVKQRKGSPSVREKLQEVLAMRDERPEV